MKLYEIDSQLEYIENTLNKWAEEHDGDVTEFPDNDYIEYLQEERENKLLNIACLIKSLIAEKEAYKAEKIILQNKEKVTDNKINNLKKFLSMNINHDEKLSDSRATLSYRKSKSVEIVDENLIPDQYFKIEKKILLSEIKKDIDNIKGAELKENFNLQIK